MMPSPRHPHPAVLCGTSDGNSKRDVGFGARNLTLLSFGGINKEWKEGGGVPLCLPSAISFFFLCK